VLCSSLCCSVVFIVVLQCCVQRCIVVLCSSLCCSGVHRCVVVLCSALCCSVMFRVARLEHSVKSWPNFRFLITGSLGSSVGIVTRLRA
jgi:hypothetical protein